MNIFKIHYLAEADEASNDVHNPTEVDAGVKADQEKQPQEPATNNDVEDTEQGDTEAQEDQEAETEEGAEGEAEGESTDEGDPNAEGLGTEEASGEDDNTLDPTDIYSEKQQLALLYDKYTSLQDNLNDVKKIIGNGIDYSNLSGREQRVYDKLSTHINKLETKMTYVYTKMFTVMTYDNLYKLYVYFKNMLEVIYELLQTFIKD